MKKSILNKITFVSGLLAFAFLANLSCAFAADRFYSTETVVASKNDADRNKAFVVAYKQLLTNLSQDPKIMSSQEIKAKLKEINNWVQSYSYIRHQGADGKPGLFLKVKFDPQSIPEQFRPADSADAPSPEPAQGRAASETSTIPDTASSSTVSPSSALESMDVSKENSREVNPTVESVANDVDTNAAENTAKSTVINAARGNALSAGSSNINLLIWLAAIGNNVKSNTIIDDANVGPLANLVTKNAQQAGFSLTLPSMDLQDIAKITADDVCDQDVKVIKSASSRYGTGAVAAGCIVQTDEGKSGQWVLVNEGAVHHWSFKGRDNADILQQAFASMAHILISAKETKAAQPVKDASPNANQSRQSLEKQVQKPSTNPTIKIISSANNAALAAEAAQSSVNASTKAARPILSTAMAPTDATLQTPALTETPASIQTPVQAPALASPPVAVGDGGAALPSASLGTVADDTVLNTNQALLYVNNISNLNQYADVVKYLHTMPAITKVELLNISLSTIKLKVSIKGGKSTLNNTLSASSGGSLKPTGSQKAELANSVALNYDWTPPPLAITP